MLYLKDVTIPANTAVSSPTSETLKLTIGTITQIEIEFPAGCCGLVGVRIDHGGWQLTPWTRSEWVISSDNVVASTAPYPIQDEPTKLTIFGYNTDTANDHTVQVRVTMREGETEEFLNLEQFLDALRGAG